MMACLIILLSIVLIGFAAFMLAAIWKYS